MIRAITASLLIASSCLAAETAATETNTEAKPQTKTEGKSSGFKMPSFSEIGALAGNVAQKFDSKLTVIEQGVTMLKPTIDALAQPANAKVAEKYTLLTQSLPKLRTAVDALKSGKVSNPKAEVNAIQDNLKTVESLYAQVQALLPAQPAKTQAATTQQPAASTSAK